MLKAKICFVLIYLCGFLSFVFAQTAQTFPFLGRVKAKDINVRVDSTVSSPVVCRALEGDSLEVVAELYDWYKVRLPKYAPAYINKGLVELVDADTAKVTKDRVNVRLMPSESSPIIGTVAQGEAVNILEFRKEWYKIQPAQNSFGWINKKFVEKSFLPVLSQENPKLEQNIIPEGRVLEEAIVIEGILKPYGKVFRRQATHKIIDNNRKVYLLKGNTALLNSLSRLKVKVSGRITSPPKAKYPLIEVDKIEVLN